MTTLRPMPPKPELPAPYDGRTFVGMVSPGRQLELRYRLEGVFTEVGYLGGQRFKPEDITHWKPIMEE